MNANYPRGAVFTFSLMLLLGGLPSGVQAGPLRDYMGYTRPGYPPSDPNAAPVRPVAEERGPRGPIGGTVYFEVFDQEKGEGLPGDPWSSGIKGIAAGFVPGSDQSLTTSSPKLDTSARYLYLYQTINDRGADSGNIKMSTVRLLIDPQYITSWGHFSFRTEKEGGKAEIRGVSFTFEGKENKVVPVSTANADVSDRFYRDPAPHYPVPKSLGLGEIPLVDRDVAVADAGADPGRAPERVVLMRSADFEGSAPRDRRLPVVSLYSYYSDLAYRPYGLGQTTTLYNAPPLIYSNLISPDYRPLGMVSSVSYLPAYTAYAGAVASTVPFPRTSQDWNRSPAVRAFWLNAPLAPGQRSTIWGFTSNYPPVYDDVRLRGNPALVNRLVDELGADVRPANLRADGEVPTPVAPVAFESGGGGGATGSVGGLMSGTSPSSGGGGGGMAGGRGGASGGGAGGGASGGGLGGGGTSGGGSGSGSGLPSQTTGTQTQPQAQAQAQITNIRITVNNNNSNGNCCHNNMGGPPGQTVPEPAAFVAAALGMIPFAFLLFRRRPATVVPAG